MDKNQVKERIEKLKAEINKHRYDYHVLDKASVSEGVLDSLKNELFKLEQKYPDLITPDSPTQRVAGESLEKFSKVLHQSPMLSLFDAFSPEDMREWETRIKKILGSNVPEIIEYYCELKMDGLAVSLVYEKGILTIGATRGNGEIGEDVTQNLKTIEAIPLKLNLPDDKEMENIGLDEEERINVLLTVKGGRLEIRGEAIMTKETFQKLNKKYKKEGKLQLSNPRNAAAGSIRQLDPQVTTERNLDFYAYSIATDLGLKKHNQEHDLLKLFGFKFSQENKLCYGIEEVIKFHHKLESVRQKIPFECDGIVVVVNQLQFWKMLGIVGKGPRYMMAYKFTAEQATTKLLDVVWQIGRTGVLTPTAILEPVKVGGVVISHATLHNINEIKRFDLRIGDTVIIERAGDVIPKIIEVLTSLRSGNEKIIEEPKECPMCGSEVIRIEKEVALRCVNIDCYAITLRRLEHWASKNALGIEGLGPKIIEQLEKEGLIRDVADFYTLTVDDLKPLERFADKSAENLIKAIKEKKEVELSRFIYALGIRHVGEETSLLLANKFKNSRKELQDYQISISEFLDFYGNLKEEDLSQLPDVGPVVGKSIYNWFHYKRNIILLRKLEKNGLIIKITNIQLFKTNISGKFFVLTGALKNLTRNEAKAKIRELGGKVSSTINKNIDYVILGEDPGIKFEKARKLGLKIINENEFLDLIK